jgi:septal ring factor EnvC (AmiA/AmiB activator)
MWIKIITTKKYNEMVKEMEELRGAHLHLHELHKGLYNKSLTEKGDLEADIKEREEKIAKLEKALRKTEHERNEALKKLKMYEKKKNG